MSLGRIISPDPVGGNFGNVTADNLYDHAIDPAAAILNVITQDVHALGGAAPIISVETPPVLFDKSLSFDGTQGLNLGDNFDLGAGDFAVAFFYRKVDALISDDATLISKGTVASDEWHIHLNLGPQKRVEWLVNAQSIELQSPNGSADDELWHHVAIVRVGSTITMYFDGVDVDSDTDSTDLTNSADLILGFRGGAPFFGGFMTGIRIYSDDLTAAQVLNLNSGGDEPTNETTFFRMAAADILSAPAGNQGTLNGGAFFDASTLPGQLQGQTNADEILAIFYDGVDDFVDTGMPDSFKPTGAMTLSIWLKGESGDSSGGSGMGTSEFAGFRGFKIGPDNAGTAQFVISSDGTALFLTENTGHDASTWTHYVGVYEPSTRLTLYRNGVQISENTTSIPASQFQANGVSLKIGRGGAATFADFSGQIAQPQMFDRVLTDPEITALFTQVNPPTGAKYDGRSNTGLIKDAEPGAPAGTVSTQFDGVNDHIQTSTVPVVSYPFSLTSWVRIRPTVSGASSAIWLGDTSVVDVEIGIDVRGTDGFARAFSRNTGTFLAAIGDVDLRDDTWHFLCGLFDNEFSRKIYVDSVEIDEQTGQTPFPNINAIAIGRASLLTPSRFTEGQIRDPRIYNRTLTQTDIDNLFAHAAVPDGLLGKFPLATEGNLVADNIGDFADTAQDSIGTNHGTLDNYAPDPNLSWVESVPAQLVGQQTSSLDFVPASSQKVSLTSEITTAGEFTVVGWMNIRDFAAAARAMIGSGVDGNTGLQFATSGRVLLRIDGGNLGAGDTVVTLNQWNHFACTRDGSGNVLYYLNGVDDTGASKNSSASASWGRLGARGTGGSAFFDGLLADWRVYSSALSPADIATLSGGGTITPAALAQWKFDDERIFETMQAWGDDAYADTVRFGSSDFAQGIPKKDSDFVENVIISATNTTGIIGASLIAPEGDRFVNGIPGNNVKLRQTGDNTASMDIQSVVPFELSGIEIDGNGFAGGSEVALSGSVHNVHQNLIHDFVNTTTSLAGIELKSGTAGSTIHTNFIWALTTTTGACTGILSAEVAEIAANSLLGIVASTDGDGAGISLSALAVLRNNVSAGSDFAYVGTAGAGSDSNIDDDGTAPGTNSVTAAAVDLFKNITPGSEDLHIKNLDSAQLGAGANLMSTGIIGIHEDIDFAARPASGVWDAGADRGTGLSEGVKALASQGAWGFSISLSIGLGG